MLTDFTAMLAAMLDAMLAAMLDAMFAAMLDAMLDLTCVRCPLEQSCAHVRMCA